MEVTEISIESLPDDLKSFITLNISQKEQVIRCFLTKVNYRFGSPEFRVVALTNYRLLVKNPAAALFIFYTWPYFKTAKVNLELSYIIKVSEIRRIEINLKKKLVYVDYGKIDKNGEHAAIGLEFGDEAQAESFGNLLKKVLAEHSVAPVTVRVETSTPDIADQLIKLAELRKNNMITDEEYEAAKRKLLS